MRTSELLFYLVQGRILSIRLNPLDALLNRIQDGLLLVVVELAPKAALVRYLAFEVVEERGEVVQRLDAFAVDLVVRGELLALCDESLDLLLGETILIVGDCDGL